jgi:hypothetical protein
MRQDICFSRLIEVAAKVGEVAVIAPMLDALVAGAPSPLRLKGERYRTRN